MQVLLNKYMRVGQVTYNKPANIRHSNQPSLYNITFNKPHWQPFFKMVHAYDLCITVSGS